jgi:hypothetical protein
MQGRLRNEGLCDAGSLAVAHRGHGRGCKERAETRCRVGCVSACLVPFVLDGLRRWTCGWMAEEVADVYDSLDVLNVYR